MCFLVSNLHSIHFGGIVYRRREKIWWSKSQSTNEIYRVFCPSQSNCHNKLLIIWGSNIKIYARIIKLIDKWTTYMQIIDLVNISNYPTYHIFEKFPNSPIWSIYLIINQYKKLNTRIRVTSSPKVSIISHVSQNINSLIKDS